MVYGRRNKPSGPAGQLAVRELASVTGWFNGSTGNMMVRIQEGGDRREGYPSCTNRPLDSGLEYGHGAGGTRGGRRERAIGDSWGGSEATHQRWLGRERGNSASDMGLYILYLRPQSQDALMRKRMDL